MAEIYEFPGFIDLHVHFRDPGVPTAETTASGAAAAAPRDGRLRRACRFLRGGYPPSILRHGWKPTICPQVLGLSPFFYVLGTEIFRKPVL
jgi:hypothetical protein